MFTSTSATKSGDLVPERVRIFWELGPYEFRSYKEVASEGLNLGAGLRKLGLAKGDKLNIYAETSCVPHVSSLIECMLATNGPWFSTLEMD